MSGARALRWMALAVTLAALAVVSAMAGCSGGGGSSDASGDETTPEGGDASSDSANDAGLDGALDALDAEPCDADITSDPANCGRCGHDCAGGPCYQSHCGPVTIASGWNNTGALAVDGTDVYWGVFGTGVDRCPISGCDGGLPDLVAGDFVNVHNIVLDSTDVYWVADPSDAGNSPNVYRCAKTGCSQQPTMLVGPLADYAMTIDSTDVYVGTVNGLLRCSKGGCSNSPTTLFTPLPSGVNDLTLDGTNVYLAYVDAILSCAQTGCALPTTLASSQTPIRVVYFGGELFWLNGGESETTGSVMRCTAASCFDATQVAGGQLQPSGIAVDSSGVYWATLGTAEQGYADSQVLMCPLSGCIGPPVVLATAAGADGVALDSTSVYWAAEVSGAGSVERVAKP